MLGPPAFEGSGQRSYEWKEDESCIGEQQTTLFYPLSFFQTSLDRQGNPDECSCSAHPVMGECPCRGVGHFPGSLLEPDRLQQNEQLAHPDCERIPRLLTALQAVTNSSDKTPTSTLFSPGTSRTLPK